MLNKIEIKDVFAHKNTSVTFKAGLTRLHGPNEAGKSQIFEMVRWGLFGNKALRTSPDDYKGGSVTLTFNGDYIVHRTTGNATLHKGDELLARSTTAVNKKIIEIIGYGLKTFDNVNSIQQDEVQKLTRMKAEDRKKFLDELIGAAQIDQLTAEYKAEGSILDAEYKALNSQIIPLREPIAPASAMTVEEIQSFLDTKSVALMEYQVQSREFQRMQTELDKFMVIGDAYPDQSIEDLEARLNSVQQQHAAQKEARINFPMIAKLVDVNAPMALDVAGLTQDVAAVLNIRQTKRPQFTPQQIADYELKHQQNDRYQEVLRLKAELETYTRCPGFEKEHEATVVKINKIVNDARPHSNLPSKEALAEAKDDQFKYDAARNVPVDSKYAELFSEPVNFDQKTYLQVYYLLVEPSEDILGLYQSIDAKKRKTEYERKENELIEQKNLLDAIDIEVIKGQVSRLKNDLAERQRYEFELSQYAEGLKLNEALKVKIIAKKAEAAETTSVVKALQGFKYYINTYFLPSVSKAATAMLVTMTNAKWKKITITEKFEISVDGKQVEALSGSTKAIVNIALRFALQFVLTKNAFSVFMADEVDGAMDTDRANYLNECLGNMVEHIGQVIVISHKDIVAPNNIKL